MFLGWHRADVAAQPGHCGLAALTAGTALGCCQVQVQGPSLPGGTSWKLDLSLSVSWRQGQRLDDPVAVQCWGLIASELF